MNEISYRINFFIQIFQSFLHLGTSLFWLFIVFQHTENIAGWKPMEIVVLMGIFFSIRGLNFVIILPCLQQLTEEVRNGTLDFILLKPQDAQFLISIQSIQIFKVVDLIFGIIIVLYGSYQIGEMITLTNILLFIIIITASIIIIYSFMLMLATTAFWFVKVENMLYIFNSMFETARWPTHIYPFWLRSILTTVIPVAFAVTVPAEALTGRLAIDNFILAIIMAIFLFLFSRWFWNFGIKSYSGASA